MVIVGWSAAPHVAESTAALDTSVPNITLLSEPFSRRVGDADTSDTMTKVGSFSRM